ncbi:MAG: hypothetical protein JWP27_30 [Flaviaesturariibacter sp.]|nr:hypothetical protein [Flaviaesturariibacter sp.]
MKRILTLAIASLIIGTVIFALFYWGAGWNLQPAVNIGLSGALGGLVTEYARSFMERRSRRKAGLK